MTNRDLAAAANRTERAYVITVVLLAIIASFILGFALVQGGR